MLDSRDLSRGRISSHITDAGIRALEALDMIEQPALFVGVPSDMLFPYTEQLELAKWVANSNLETIESIHSHETFLIEAYKINMLLLDFLENVSSNGLINEPKAFRKKMQASNTQTVMQCEVALVSFSH